jgi:hypothetical protein
MLGSRYISIAGSAIPNPTKFDYSFDRIEKSYKTEAGNEYVLIKGGSKLSASLTFQATSTLKATLEALYTSAAAVTVVIKSTTYTNCFISSFSADLVKDSERTANTDGLWEVSIDIRGL